MLLPPKENSTEKKEEKITAIKKSDKYFLNQLISSFQQQLIRLIICTFHIQGENNTSVVTVLETYYYNLTMNIPNEKHSTAMMTVFFTTVKVLKDSKNLRNCHTHVETKETGQLNVK